VDQYHRYTAVRSVLVRSPAAGSADDLYLGSPQFRRIDAVEENIVDVVGRLEKAVDAGRAICRFPTVVSSPDGLTGRFASCLTGVIARFVSPIA
jgi:hypothetical protein